MQTNNEEWKDIKEYEGFYQVSNFGRVRSLKRLSTKGKILRQMTDKDGYLKVCLSKHNVATTFFVHRLVAKAFLPNDDPFKTCINHKNEIKNDNRVENLEWCTVKYNTTYKNMNYRRVKNLRKQIVGEKDGVVTFFYSVNEAANILNVNHGNISGCLHGYYGRKSLRGYTFRFPTDEETKSEAFIKMMKDYEARYGERKV